MIIGGRYKVTDRVGDGGMGCVYRAEDLKTGETVAIKQLHDDLTEDAQMLERFRREAQALRRLKHPGIVQIVDTVEENGRHYLVMEFMAGGDLFQMLQRKRLSVRRVVEMAISLADALAATHALNIIHRDLKPENILFDECGNPHLSDFGTALLRDSARITLDGHAVGTMNYISPEVVQYQTIDQRADVWSLGVLMYEMLTRKLPFNDASKVTLMLAIMYDPLPDLRAQRPDVPDALDDLWQQMLERDTNQRIQDMRGVADELRRIARHNC